MQENESEGNVLKKELESKYTIQKAEYEEMNKSKLKLNIYEIDKEIFMKIDIKKISTN